MRLVVSGYYGYANAGDEAVLAGLLQTLRELDPGVDVTVVSGHPDATRREHGVDAVPRMAVGALSRSLRAAHGLLSGGGSLLQDRTSVRPVGYYAGVMFLARALGRPYAVHAQGLGPITHVPNRWLAAAALRGAAHVTLRDPDSVALAREMGVRRAIDLAPDPALALRLPGGRDGSIVVAVRDWAGQTEHLAGVRAALLGLSRDHRIVALPMQDPADRAASESVVGGIPGATVVDADGLAARLTAIGGASLVIGMRVHAIILAAAAHVPALAISYDPKVDAFAAQVGQPVVGRAGQPIDAVMLEETARAALAADPGPYVERVEALRGGVTRATAGALDAIRRRAR
jgi:polysaccharide pyruvyl transferase CsaB